MSKSRILVPIVLILAGSCRNYPESNTPPASAGSSEESSPCVKKRTDLAFQIDRLVEDTSVVLGDLRSFEASGYALKNKKIDSLKAIIDTLECRDEAGYGNYGEVKNSVSRFKAYNRKKYMEAATAAHIGCNDPIIIDVAEAMEGFETPVKRLTIKLRNGCAIEIRSITILVGDPKRPSSCDIIKRFDAKILPWGSGIISLQIKDGCDFKGNVEILGYQKRDGKEEITGIGSLYQINKADANRN